MKRSARAKLLGALTGVAATVAGSVASVAAPNCLYVFKPTAAGHYNSVGYYQIGRESFMVGQEPGFAGSQLRNWFVFSLPPLPSPLVGAELRISAVGVATVDGSETYELHAVTTPVATLVNYAGNTTNTFNDLGDGALFGSHTIRTTDSAPAYGGFGALLTIPFTPEGLAAIPAAQGGSFAVGGVLATLDNDPATVETAFRGGLLAAGKVDLLLYVAGSGPPQVAMFSPATSVLAGAGVSLSAAACGASPLSLQWLKDNAPLPGATNATHDIPFTLPADSGLYQLRASNALGVTLSSPVSVEVTALSLFQQPVSVTVYPPAPAALSVGVLSELPLTYQWRRNGVNLLGANSGFLLFDPVTAADSGNYDVIARNAAGSVTSVVATVTVLLYEPQVTYQPASQEIAVGRPLYLAASVFGSAPLFYQWFKDGQILPGASSQVLQLAATQFSDAGDYQLVVSNPAGAVTSAVARVTVVGLKLSYGPATSSTLLSNSATITVLVESSARVFYQWYFNGTLLTGQTNQFLQIPTLTPGDIGDYFVIAQNVYTVVTSQVATLTVTTQPPAATVYVSGVSGGTTNFLIGNPITFAANVFAGPPAVLQWLHNGLPVPGANTNVLRLGYALASDSGSYAIWAQNPYGSVTSAPVAVQVAAQAPFFTLVPGATSYVAGSVVTLRSVASAGPPADYQWSHRGQPIAGATNATLTLSGVTVAQSGPYEVVARNEFGQTSYSLSLVVRSATGLDRWDWNRPRPQGNRLRDVTHANGRYVAVGKSGNLITSSDGVTWTNLILEVDADFDEVTYGNGRFLAAGDNYTTDRLTSTAYPYPVNLTGILISSADGLNWSVHESPEGDGLGRIAFGNGRFVATSRFGKTFAYTSEDGVHWTPQTVDDRRAVGLAWGNGRFVASTGDRLYSSSDGIQWSLAYSSPYDYLQTVAYGNGGFLAVGWAGEVLASTTGEQWAARGFVNFQVWSLTAGAGHWVGVANGPAGSLVVSSEGVSWNSVDTGTAQEIESVVFADGRFLAVGEAGTITTSQNGVGWSPSLAANRIDYYGITRAGSVVAVAGDSGTILTTTDGQTWTARSTPTTRNLHAIHYANGLFVAGGRRGALITSPDGSLWTARASRVDNYLERITWANGRWVAVGESGDYTTSLNGVDWTAGRTGPPYSDHEGVAFGNGRWVIVGGYFRDPVHENEAVSTIYASEDALTWTLSGSSLGKRLRDVTFAQGVFVAVGNDGMVLTSTNTTYWTLFQLGFQNLRRVSYANGRFVVVGNNGELYSSPNPAQPNSWVAHRSHSSLNLHDIAAAAGGTFFAVGNNGMILQSGGTLPSFTGIQSLPEGYQLRFDPGLAGSNLRLESSPDLHAWTTTATGITSPVTIPPTNGPLRFFRLAIP